MTVHAVGSALTQEITQEYAPVRYYLYDMHWGSPTAIASHHLNLDFL